MKKNKVSTLVHFILDQSGSMGSILNPTINGFNEYVQGLQSSKVKFRFSLTLFNALETKTPYTNIPVKQVQPLNTNTFIPNGGTPLYDAVVDSVEKLHTKIGDSKEPVIVAIMTDGEENMSVNHTQACLKELVEKLQNKGNWTFVYMGANQDAWQNAANFGILRGNTMSWNSTAQGTNDAFYSLSASSANFARGTSAGILKTASFFNNDDKKGGK